MQLTLGVIAVPVKTNEASSIDFDQNKIASGEFAGDLTVNSSLVEHDSASRRYSHDNLTSKTNCVERQIDA